MQCWSRGVHLRTVWLNARSHRNLKDLAGAVIKAVYAAGDRVDWPSITERVLEKRFGRIRTSFPSSEMGVAHNWRASATLMRKEPEDLVFANDFCQLIPLALLVSNINIYMMLIVAPDGNCIHMLYISYIILRSYKVTALIYKWTEKFFKMPHFSHSFSLWLWHQFSNSSGSLWSWSARRSSHWPTFTSVAPWPWIQHSNVGERFQIHNFCNMLWHLPVRNETFWKPILCQKIAEEQTPAFHGV